jgi:hypothetical protein
MHTLAQQQFTVCATQQIDSAVAMLVRHHDGCGGSCSCGRELPCTVHEACHRTPDHYQGKIALLEAMTKLSMLPATEEPRRVMQWRRVLRGCW